MKRGITLAVVILMSLLVSSVAFGQNYADVSSNHWAAEAIQNLTDLNILTGIKGPDGQYYFNGNDPLTRYQTALVVQKLLDYIGGGKIAPDATIAKKLDELEMALTDEKGNTIQMLDILSRLDNIETRVAGGTPAGEVDSKALDSITRQLGKLVEDMAYMNRDIKNANTKATDVESLIAAMDSRVSELEKAPVSGDTEVLAAKVTRNTDMLTTLQNNVAALSETIVSVSEKADDLDSTFAAFSRDLGKVTANAKEIENINAALRTIYAAIDEKATKASVNDLNVKISELKASFDSIEAPDLTAVTGDIANLQTKINNIAANYLTSASLKNYATLADVESRIRFAAGKDELDALSSLVSNLEKGMNNDISALNSKTDGLTANIVDLNSNLVAVTDKVNMNASILASIPGDIANLKNKLAALEAKAENMDLDFNSRFATMQEAISASVNKIAVLENDLASLSGNFDTLNTQIGSNTKNISLNKSSIDSLNSKINVVAADLDSTKKTMTIYARKSDFETLSSNVSDSIANMNNQISGVVTADELEAVKKQAQTFGFAGIAVGIIGIILGVMGMGN